MAIKQKVYKVGSSLVVTIPSKVAQLIDIHEGDPIHIKLENNRVIIEFPKIKN